MAKVKYYFNTHSLKYEKVVVSIKKRLLSAFAFLSTAGVFATLILVIAYSYFDSPKEKKLKREINNLSLQYEVLSGRLKQVSSVLKDMEERDDDIYRVIFEAEPISDNVRNAGFGGVNRYKSLEGYESSDLIVQTTEKLDKISKQMYIQSKSFDEVFKLVKNKSEMLASIPAIQPISKKNLKMIASGFGYRIDPLYKTIKMHTGLDFAAAMGTPIYSSGNGVIKSAQYEQSGYGNCVVINHGYGYQTLYGHMSRIAARPGQKVNRGDIIGYVGSTGKSTNIRINLNKRK